MCTDVQEKKKPTSAGNLSALRYRALHAPRENRAAVVEPPFADVGDVLARNLALRGRYDYDFHGRSLADLARAARDHLLQEAWRWTSAYRDVAVPRNASPDLILLAGHQPQLFHPGVWLKNFALGTLAAVHGGVAVNLVIDSDTLKSPTLAVPGGSPHAPRIDWLPFDRPLAGVPYEERPIVDRAVFDGFGRQAAERIRTLVPAPLMERYWPMAQQRAAATGNLGAALAQSRHQLESQWGLTTLEVPQSRICSSEPFFWFVAHLLAELPRFVACYNAAVHEYRRAHKIRNAAQPVPDLVVDGPWHEMPLWLWTAQQPRRRRVFARRTADGVVLSDREAIELALPLSADGSLAAAVERLLTFAAQGVKLRSRALVTTFWARLALGDLFLHGIGGANYDQVTDVLIERFFGLTPPALMVLSATLHLPVARPTVDEDDLRAIARQSRELTYHPEQFIVPAASSAQHATPTAAQLVSADSPATARDGAHAARDDDDARVAAQLAEKRRWIATPVTPENARARCRAIRTINEALQPHVAAQRARLEALRVETDDKLHAARVLTWREYAFCLFPENLLREFWWGLLPKRG